MDLMWQGDALLVAGPDTRAQRHPGRGPDYTGLRFPPGMLPALLGVPAGELRDRQVRLDEVLPTARVRRWESKSAPGAPAASWTQLACRSPPGVTRATRPSARWCVP